MTDMEGDLLIRFGRGMMVYEELQNACTIASLIHGGRNITSQQERSMRRSVAAEVAREQGFHGEELLVDLELAEAIQEIQSACGDRGLCAVLSMNARLTPEQIIQLGALDDGELEEQVEAICKKIQYDRYSTGSAGPGSDSD